MRTGERRTLGVALTAAGVGALLCLVVLSWDGASRTALRSKVSCDGAPALLPLRCCWQPRLLLPGASDGGAAGGDAQTGLSQATAALQRDIARQHNVGSEVGVPRPRVSACARARGGALRLLLPACGGLQWPRA